MSRKFLHLNLITATVIYWGCLLLCGCNHSFDPLPPTEDDYQQPTHYIESLAELCDQGVRYIDQDVVVQGSVTTNDSCGNFYRSVMVEDPTGAIELRLGLYDIYTLFREGELVNVKLRGLGISRSEGMLQVGMASDSVVGYIDSAPMVIRHVIRKGSQYPILAPVIEIKDIKPKEIGRILTLKGGHFTQGGERTWSGERTYSAQKGVSIIVYTSPYATFAADTLPVGEVSLRGVVMQYRGVLQFRISSPDDVLHGEGM